MPSQPTVVVTSGRRFASASTTFSRVPAPTRIGTIDTSARSSSAARSSTGPIRSTPSRPRTQSTRSAPLPTIRTRASGTDRRTDGITSRTNHSTASVLGS